MRILFRTILLLVAVSCLHFAGVFFGIYEHQIQQGNVWFDNILHALDGVIFAYAWFSHRKEQATFIGVITFVVLLAIGWEVIEYGFMIFSPAYAVDLKIYSPSILEAMQDILSNIAGGIIAFFLFRK